MAKMHQLKPKPPDQGQGGGGEAPLPSTRPMQVTLSQEVHVLLMRIGALWVEHGIRPGVATKSAVIEAGIRLLAKSEGLLK